CRCSHGELFFIEKLADPRDVISLAIVIVEKTIAVERPYGILEILKAGAGKEAEIAEQHDSTVAFTRKEVTREYRPFRRFAHRTGLLDGESKRFNELAGSQRSVVGQVVFDKSVIHQLF